MGERCSLGRRTFGTREVDYMLYEYIMFTARTCYRHRMIRHIIIYGITDRCPINALED